MVTAVVMLLQKMTVGVGSVPRLDTTLLVLADTLTCPPDNVGQEEPGPSSRERALSLISSPRSTAIRRTKQLQQKREVIWGGLQPEGDWLLISSKEGKGLKVKEEDRAETVAWWAGAHPDVVCSPLGRDAILAPASAADDPARTAMESKLLLQTKVRAPLRSA